MYPHDRRIIDGPEGRWSVTARSGWEEVAVMIACEVGTGT